MPRHPEDKSYEWNPRVLNYLVNKSGIGQKRVAEQLGISYASLRKYMSGDTAPGIDALIKLANGFGVALDILLVRCGEGPLQSMEENYEDYFYLLNRTRYETPLLKCSTSRNLRIKPGYEAPWPYNLLDDIFNEPFDRIMTDEMEAGLQKVIESKLSVREQKAIEYYYFEGMTLEDAGKQFDIQRERMRQILAKAIRKMRHPGCKRTILFGEEKNLEYQEACRHLNERRIELEKREYELNRYEEEVRRLIGEHNDEIIHQREIDEKLKLIDYDTPNENSSGLSDKFLDLDLSVRSFNCLSRAGVRTVEDLKECIRSGNISKIRNFGLKCYEEVIEKIKKLDGEDLSLYEFIPHQSTKGYFNLADERRKRERALAT